MLTKALRNTAARWLLAVVLALGASGPLVQRAVAADIRTGPAASVAAGDTVTDDLYLLDSEINIAGTVKGDVVAAGFLVVVSGRVEGNLVVAAPTVIVTGAVMGSIVAVGMQVQIDGSAGKDLLGAGGTFALGKTGSIKRDALVAAANLTVRGSIGDDLRTIDNVLVIEGTVGHDVTTDTDNFTVGPSAEIKGNISHVGERDAQVDPAAKIAGQIEHRLRLRASNLLVDGIGIVQDIFGQFVFGLLFLAAPVRPVVRRTCAKLAAGPLACGAVGLATAIIVPLAAVFALVIGLATGGWFMALLAIEVYTVAGKVGTLITALTMGPWLAERFGRKNLTPVYTMGVGVLGLSLLGALPLVGGVFGFVAWWCGLGAIVTLLLEGMPSETRPGAVPPSR